MLNPVRFVTAKVGRKILFGFLLMAILMLGLGGLVLKRVSDISTSVEDLSRNLARELSLHREIAGRTGLMRLAAGSYIDTHSQDSLNSFNENYAILLELIESTQALVKDRSSQEAMTEIGRHVEEYGQAFREVARIVLDRQLTVLMILDDARYRAEKHLSAIRVLGLGSTETSILLALGNVQKTFLEMLLQANKYLDVGDERYGVLFDKAYTQTLELFAGMSSAMENDNGQAAVFKAVDAVRDFKAGFDSIRTDFRTQHRLKRERLDILNQAIATSIAESVAEIEARFTFHENQANQLIADSKREIVAILAAILTLGAVLSIVIARRITSPLIRVMRASTTLADTDLRLFSGQLMAISRGGTPSSFKTEAKPLEIDQPDEVGGVARAFNAVVHRIKEAESAFEAMGVHFRRLTAAAGSVARGDLEVEVRPASESDELGRAIAEMILSLRRARDVVELHQNHLSDLVAQKTTELDESRRYLSTLLGNLPGMAYRCIFDQDWTMEFASQGSLALTGYAPDELVGNRVVAYNDIVHPEDRDQLAGEVGLALSEKRPFEVRYRIVTKSGQVRWVWESGQGVNTPGGLTSMIEGFITDITEQKRHEEDRLEMERRLLHAQKLESLGVLAGGIAHDFNNLLSALLGSLELSLKAMDQNHPSRPGIERAQKAARLASALSLQMLAYSGRGQFMFQAVDVSRCIAENLHIFQAAISKTITLQLDLARDLPPIMADPAQLQQVVMNLITNASEAIGEGVGVMRLNTGRMEASADLLTKSRLEEKPEPGDYVWLEVEDSGCGMDQAAQARIFDPFFTTKFTGRGLGLSSVLGIVRSHRGAIFIKSVPGRGTTIRILFPVGRPETAEDPIPPQPPMAEPGPALSPLRETSISPTILVVDDEPMILEMCAEALHDMGYRVLLASDGQEGVEILAADPEAISCVLLDLTMPRMDGPTAFVRMREIRADIKVVLCSGYSEQEATSRFQGLAGFIQKPYRIDELKTVLERVLTEDLTSAIRR
ncbi:MAG: response regulator [Deltaproteobacteria bacterium]|nr:response regulator [Deltaproteobacteria bacterium]